MTTIKSFFSLFWSVLLMGLSLLTVLAAILNMNFVYLLMLIPFFMGFFSIKLIRKNKLDLSSYFLKTFGIAIFDSLICALSIFIFTYLSSNGSFYFFLITPILLSLINKLIIFSFTDDLNECFAMALSDPITYYIFILIVSFIIVPRY